MDYFSRLWQAAENYLNSLALNSQFGTVFQEKVSLPGKTPNHLKFRILERGNAVLKPGLKISFGLFISAEYKRSQNPDNYNINTSTIGTYPRPNNRKCGHFFYFGWYSAVLHSRKVMSSSPEYGIV